MKVDTEGRTIKQGDRVRIAGLGLSTDTGTVLDANWWRDAGWYIELTWDDGIGYGYWKQDYDGGHVELLNKSN